MPSLHWLWVALGIADATEPSNTKVLSAPNLAFGDFIGRLAELEERVQRLEEELRNRA